MPKNVDISKVKEALKHKANPYPLELWLKDFANGEDIQQENSFYGYIPIRLVALIEDSIRDEYALIIDDKRYRKNLTEVIDKNIPLNVEVLSSLQDDVISIGEYFSYSLSCNGIEDINKNFSKLLGCSFHDELNRELGEDTNNVLRIVGMIFKERHVLCHESSVEPGYDKSTIVSFIQSVLLFIEAIRCIIQSKLYPDFPQTTAEMIIEAIAEFEAVDKELEETIQIIKDNDLEGLIEEMGSLLFIENWKEYRETRAKVDSNTFEDGSMQPIIFYNSLSTTTKWLIKELRSTYKSILRSVNK